MKSLSQSLKKNFKYAICLLAIFIFTIQIYQIVTEEKIIEVSNDVSNIENNSDPIAVQEECKKSEINASSILMCVFKCSVAFLFGGMISDRKFIKFGAF